MNTAVVVVSVEQQPVQLPARPYHIDFSVADQVVGTLDFSGGEAHFIGCADLSARILFDEVFKLFDQRLVDERLVAFKRAIEAAKAAQLPKHYQWGRDARESFDFGIERAVTAITEISHAR